MKTVDPTTIPAIPVVPGQITPEMARYLTSLSEALEVRLGRKGDNRDRAVTIRELIAAGLVDETFSPTFDLNSISSTTLGIKPSGPATPTEIVPTTPTGFTATAAYAKVLLQWDQPDYSGHSFTEIWRSATNLLGDATFLNLTTGRTGVDEVGAGAVTFYYWIRHVSSTGNIGAWNSQSGTSATTTTDVEHILEVIDGAITNTQLSTALGTRINGGAAETGSIAADIAAEASARTSAISTAVSGLATSAQLALKESVANVNTIKNNLQSQINSLNNTPAWDTATAYSTNDQVIYSNHIYRAKRATTGDQPDTSTDDWELLGEYTSLASVVGANSASITTLQTAVAGKADGSSTAASLSALQTNIDAIDTSGIATNASAISTLETNLATKADGSSTAASISALQTSIGGIATNASAISALETNLATKADGSSVASQIATLSSSAATMLFSGYIGKNTFEDGEKGAWTGVTVATAPAGHPLGRTKALKQEDRDAYYLAPTTDGFFQTSAHDKTFRVTGYVYNASNTTARAGLNSKNPTNGNSWPVETSAPANSGEWVRYDNTFTVADGDGTRLRPFLQINGFQGDGTEFEAYWTDMTLIEVSDAVVPDVANPDGTVGTVSIETAATTQASINGGLSAQYTVKIDNAGFVAGYGLASTSNQAGGSTTEFKVRADSFQIQSTGITAEAPFTVITSPFTKNGEPVDAGVYIADAFIAEGTITNAKIGNAAIDDAKIISLNANKITAGTIDVSKVNVQGTGGISVTSASTGSRLEIRNDHIKIYNGLQLRVQIGNLDA